MTEKLNSNFLVELAKLCLLSKETTAVVRQHLNYSFIQLQEHKEIFKYIFDYQAANNKVPTLGTLSQNLPQTPTMIGVLSQVRAAEVYDSKEQLLQSFEQYIRKGRFQKVWADTQELFNNQKHDEAISLMEKETKSINEFSLSAEINSRVFADFDSRSGREKAARLLGS